MRRSPYYIKLKNHYKTLWGIIPCAKDTQKMRFEKINTNVNILSVDTTMEAIYFLLFSLKLYLVISLLSTCITFLFLRENCERIDMRAQKWVWRCFRKLLSASCHRDSIVLGERPSTHLFLPVWHDRSSSEPPLPPLYNLRRVVVRIKGVDMWKRA